MKFDHRTIHLKTTECLQFIDLTEEIAEVVRRSGVKNGLVNVQTRHTTTAVLINEHEPLLIEDMRRAVEAAAPRSLAYRHDDFAIRTVNLEPQEKSNGHAHCKALFLPSSETVNVVEGRMQLGRWQRVFFVELDCARERQISVVVMGQ